MSYLFTNNQEIKNDSGNPIPSEIIHEGSVVSPSNPLSVQFSNASINIGAEVEISNDVGNPVPVSGTISVDNLPAFPTVQTVDGTVIVGNGLEQAVPVLVTNNITIDNLPGTQTISGTVGLDSATLISLENINANVTGMVSIDNLPDVQEISGTVSLDSASLLALETITAVVTFPEVQTVQGTVSLDSTSLSALENITVEVSSTVTVDNLPAIQTVQGTVSLDSTSLSALENITVEVSSTVTVDNLPAIQTVQGTVSLDSTSLSALEDINVTVNNFPAIQDVSGTVSIDNLPAIQTVQGTVSLDSTSLSALENINANVIGTVSIDNLPAIQTVQGTVSLDSVSLLALETITAVVTFPEVQTVQGTVSLDSTSLSALENITVEVSSTVSIDNLPAIQTVQGTVSLDSTSLSALEDINVTVNNFPATQDVSGTVSIDNLPAIQTVQGTVSLDSASLLALETITAVVTFPEVQTVSLDSASRNALENITAEVSNFPVVQTISGTVIIGNEPSAPVPVTVSSDISISNFPAVQTVSLDSSSRDALENITATVAFPSTQIVSLDSSSRNALENITATVAFPSTQIVSLDSSSRNALENITAIVAFPSTQIVSLDSSSRNALENITVEVSNFPAVQTVDGTVGLDSNSLSALENITATISNFPTTQNVSGTVGLDSNSLSALENITVDTISNPVTIQDGGNSITVDGEVSITSLPEVEIKNDSGNPISISRNNTTNSQLNPIFVKGASDTTFFDPSQLDAFGRLRVSNPHTLFESSFRYTDSLYRWNQKTVGTGSSTIDINASVINLSVGSIVNDSVIRETERVFGYQPGKSLLILSTFTMNPAKENLRQRVGYFGKDNGIYFEVDGTQVSIVKRSSSGGSIQETKVLQSNWLNDPLDGTGRSGITLDPSKSQIFWTDIEWLGVGSVRTGFIIDGKYIICHTFHHANSIESTYMTTASLPLRYEITNTGNTSGNSTLKQICSTVISEGGYNPAILTQSASTPLTGKNLTVGIENPMVSIRLRSGKTDGIVIPKEVNFYGLQSTAYKYKIIKDGILSNPSWQIADSSHIAEYDLDADSIQGGVVIYEGLFKGQSNVNPIHLSEIFENSIQLTRGIIENDSAGDTFSITLEPTTNNDDAIVSLSWQSHNA